jgi:hypothetical protein
MAPLRKRLALSMPALSGDRHSLIAVDSMFVFTILISKNCHKGRIKIVKS